MKFFLFSHLLNVPLSNILINRLYRTVLVFYKYDKKTQSSHISSHHYLSSLLPHYLPFIFPNIHIIHSYYSLVDSFAAAWIAAFQAPLSMEFPKQEYWNGLPFPFLGDLPSPGIKPTSLAVQADSLPLSHLGS